MHGPVSTVNLFSSPASLPPDFHDLRLRCAAHQAVLVLRALGQGSSSREHARDAAAWLEASLAGPPTRAPARANPPEPRPRPLDAMLDAEVRDAQRLAASCPKAQQADVSRWLRAAQERLLSLASYVRLGRMQFALDLAGRESFAKGLAWYADPASYDGHGRPGEAGDESGEFELDLGERARLILAMIGET